MNQDNAKRNAAIIQSLARVYFASYYVDLAEGTAEEIKAIDSVSEEVRKERAAADTINQICERFIMPDYQEGFRQYTDLQFVKEYLGKHDIVTYEYEGKALGWCRLTILPVLYKEDEVTHVLYAFQRIQDERERQRKLEQDLCMVAKASSVMYPLAIAINLTDNEYHMITYDNFINKTALESGTVEDLIQAGASTIPNEIQQKEFQRKFNRQAQIEAYEKGVKETKLRHQQWADDGTIHWMETIMLPVSLDDGKMREISVARVVDEEVELIRQEQKQNRTLQERMNIIDSLAKTYYCVYYIDLFTNTFTEVDCTVPEVHEAIGSQGDAQEKLAYMCEHMIFREFKEDMLKFTDLTTMGERLKRRDYVTHQFRGTITGWSEGIFIAGDRNFKGSCRHVVWAIREINEQKRLENENAKVLQEAYVKAEAANKAKSTFLFNMSHDIRTPMNAIMGFADLLEKHDENPEKRKEYIGHIKTSSNYLLDLINSVLEMARIESGTATIDEEVVELNKVIESLQVMFEKKYYEKSLTVTRDVRMEHEKIYVDRGKLQEIFLNILSNAIKYTPEGGAIHISVLEQQSANPGFAKYEFSIEDTGIGISKEFLPHIFDSFSRERTVTESKIVGTGLGMGIVKKLIELMDGTICVESELGKGTKVTVNMQARIAAEEEYVGKKDIEIDSAMFSGKRILLAEDNELNREIAVTILEEAGLLVESAEDGIQCIAMLTKAEANYYDAILMDIQMPNMNGLKATSIIRKLDDVHKATIPIIAMTANVFDEDQKRALEAGMNAFVGKPIRLPELFGALFDVMS